MSRSRSSLAHSASLRSSSRSNSGGPAAHRYHEHPVVVADPLVAEPVVELVGAHLEVEHGHRAGHWGDLVLVEPVVTIDQGSDEVADERGLAGLELCGEHDPRAGRLPAVDAPPGRCPGPGEPVAQGEQLGRVDVPAPVDGEPMPGFVEDAQLVELGVDTQLEAVAPFEFGVSVLDGWRLVLVPRVVGWLVDRYALAVAAAAGPVARVVEDLRCAAEGERSNSPSATAFPPRLSATVST